MAKVNKLTSKTIRAMFCILLLVLAFGCASSARILDEVSQVADASPETDEPVVAPVVAPVTVTAPDSDVAPVADPSIPADTVAPPADLPAEPEPDSTPVIAPAVSVAPPADLPDTGAAPHPTFSFFMHDILGGTHPSGRVVTGIVATSDANNLPFSKLNNQIFPINGGVSLNNINNFVNNNNYPFLAGLNGQQQANTILQNSGNNNIVNGDDNQPFVTAGQLPAGLSLQQLMFGSITVVDNEITEGHELGSAVLGRAQGFYLTSSSDGTSHTLALTTLFHGEHNHEIDDTISFFGVHRTATPISHIAIIGGTGKYENVKGFATIETLPHVDQHTTDGLETITHFTVYITP
ncbi:Dirigent protein 24 [Capsicum annuum]|uniref:Dirigent protein n=1 Tax=Capsicum annuum TaxID=4072 RepID=A0A2G2XXS7_CAPAN|nr:Dirigent protein 24 [Capsicum annuum]